MPTSNLSAHKGPIVYYVLEKFYPPLQWQFEDFTPPPPPHGWIVEKFLGTTPGNMRTDRQLSESELAREKNHKLGEIQVRKRTLEYLFNVLIITMFCYCWSLFFTRQKKVHRRSKQLGVWEQYRSIWCMDVDM